MANSAKKKIAAILMPIAAMRVVVLKEDFLATRARLTSLFIVELFNIYNKMCNILQSFSFASRSHRERHSRMIFYLLNWFITSQNSSGMRAFISDIISSGISL